MGLLLRGARLIDATGADPFMASVATDGVRIARVDPGSTEPTRGEQVVETEGLTVLPGLIDAHSHFGVIAVHDADRMPPAVMAAHIFRNCELALDAGFTTVRDVGGVDGALAQAIELGLVRGPRLYPSGAVLVQTGGHGDYWPPFLDHPHHDGGHPGLSKLSTIADGADEVRVAVRRNFQRGATQIKMCISGGVVSLTDRLEDAQFSVAELRAAVEEAQARGTYVTGHAHNVRSIRNGLEAGLECFEHASFLDEETAAALAAKGAAVVPTLAVTRLLADNAEAWGLPPEAVPRIRGVEAAMRASVKLAHDAGVVIGSGSDILGPEQDRRGLELVLKAEVLGPMEAIVSATRTNAGIIRREDLGTVEPGKTADLVALDGDPLIDPTILDDPSRVVLVIKDGAIVKDRRS